MPKTNTSLSEPAYNHILNLIMSKQLMPGDKVPETKIAQEFKISRTPVRDAMRQLANEGLIEIFPNRYAQVYEYTEEMVAEIGALRLSLDTLAVKLAALYGSRADFMKLADIAKQCESAFNEGNLMLKRQLDADFHLLLAQISNNSLLIKFQRELYLRVQFILLHRPNVVYDEKRHMKQHYEIAEALMNNDEAKASAIILDHLTSFYDLKSKYPEDFFHLPFAT